MSNVASCPLKGTSVGVLSYPTILRILNLIRVGFLSKQVPTHRWCELTLSPRAPGTIMKTRRAIFRTRKNGIAGTWTHAHHVQKRTIYAPSGTDSARDVRAQTLNYQFAERYILTCQQYSMYINPSTCPPTTTTAGGLGSKEQKNLHSIVLQVSYIPYLICSSIPDGAEHIIL